MDDDPHLRTLCRATLEGPYRVTLAEHGQEALRRLYQERPDLVLLDVSMPVLDGWETCRRIRELSDTPVIMLTARGADDYIAKPFSPTVLLARVRALLRRRAPEAAEPAALSFDDGRLVVDLARRVAVVRGQEVALSATEFKLLEVLARHAGQVLSHEQILEHVWGAAYAGETGYVKTYVGFLRNKLEADPRNPEYLLARRGLGYYLERRGRQSRERAVEP